MQERAFDLRDEPVDIPESALTPPVLSYITERGCWRLEAPYEYDDEGTRIRVPRGFEFDLASIPRPLWWLVAPFELSVAAPLLHDFLYRYGGEPPEGSVTPPRTWTRKESDVLFDRVMRREGVPAWRRALAYRAVRWFGGGAWGRLGRYAPA